ncbi:MAG TPA: hypothetical protein VM012_02560 [Flavitalea sp.]|nr:hypothetical protein [Flavitalea sp.]
MNWRKAIYVLTHWERWYYRVKYIPLAPFWIWYCIRAGSWWFFTPSNPSLTFGGFEGESKKEMYQQLPPETYPVSIYISPGVPFQKVLEQLKETPLQFPFVVKPDVGMMGFLFRKIDDVKQLQRYHEYIPTEYIIQELADYPIEVSVFYYRFPGQEKGTITGFLKKEGLEVIGNGKKTLEELILEHPRAKFRMNEMRSKHLHRLSWVIPEGELFVLSWAANLSRGGKLVNLEHEKDEKLLKVFDNLSNYTKHFYYGRYDIKCKSVQDLKEGKNFTILEYNGSGAEPHHVYGNGNNLIQASVILLQHWKILYRISMANRRLGIPFWKYKEGMNYLKKARNHFKLLKKLDREFT